MTTQYCPASSIDGLIADSENALSWLFQFSQPSGMEDESLEGPALAAMLQQPAGGHQRLQVQGGHMGGHLSCHWLRRMGRSCSAPAARWRGRTV
jgi:hypothetical protein